MDRYFSKYELSIVDKVLTDKNKQTIKIASIELFDEKGRINKLEKDYIDTSILYDKIDKKDALIYDNVFVENFSLADYRKSRNIPKNELLELSNVVFTNSFFISSEKEDKSIDFSYAKFTGENNCFRETIFSGHLVTFSNSVFENNTSFEYSIFHFIDVHFSKASFKKGIVSFKNSLFKEGTKIFDDTIFNCNSVLFINAEFGDGDFHFHNAVFADTIISFKIARFGKGRVDFSKTSFGKKLTSFEKVEFGDGHVNFRSTTFENANVEFIRCVFGTGDVSFIGAIFREGNVTFTGSEFGDGKISFKQAYFGNGKIDFHYSRFGTGDLIFERTNFTNGNVDFRAVDFGVGKITFNRAIFGDGEVIFEASELEKGKVTFRKTSFGIGVFNFEMANFANSEITFEDVNFGAGKVSFNQSKFAILSLQSSQMNNYFDLRVEKCGKLDLSNTIVKDVIDISAIEFPSIIEAIDLQGMRLLGRIYIDWRKHNIKELILKQDVSNASKAAQFLLLKENYNTIGQYDYEDEAYVEFKRTESKSILENAEDKPFKQKTHAKIRYWFQLLIFDKVGLYATDPIRVLFSMSIVYLLFTFIFILLQYLAPDAAIISSLFPADDPRNLSPIQKSFYHSAITFLTIGYGDYYPSGISRWISALEGFIGLFLMSYFTVAFVRRILR